MEETHFTEKQKKIVSMLKHKKLKRINLLEGSVRSGKTWISLLVWAMWIANRPEDGNYLMCAKTLTSLRRNCLEPLVDILGSANFSYSIPAKEGRLFKHRIYLEGAADARSEGKIRGLTLDGAYCDELTLFAEEFFSMLLSRLSRPGAKLIATTNPDSPSHWLYQDYIKRSEDLDMLIESYTIDDNDTLDPKYVAALKNEYTGVFYDRYILGLWRQAEGLVYPMFDAEKHTVKSVDTSKPGQWYISIDYGTLNPCAMGLWWFDGINAVQVSEYYHDGRKTRRQLTDEEYYSALEELAGKRQIRNVIVDPSAASFIACIRKHGRLSVRGADNRVLDGIRLTGSLLASEKIKIAAECENTIREFGLYCWDENSTGMDKVIKENDHAMDQTRYFAMTVMRRHIRGLATPVMEDQEDV
ncbi:MAG: PBSX family phage terminase large subunit [Lentisphaeria bacterium]